MTTPFGYFDLLETFAEPGCAVCRLLERDIDRFLDSLLYEYPTDPITQRNFRASRGLCHEHTWRLTKYNSVLAVAILYDQALHEVMQVAEQTPNGKSRRRSGDSPLADALEAQKPCPACDVRDRSEKTYLELLGQYVTDERLREAFRRSDGLCLPHFRGVLRVAKDTESASELVAVQRASWSKLRDELQEFLHKMDAHYHQQMGTEATSWLRAMARMVGDKRG